MLFNYAPGMAPKMADQKFLAGDSSFLETFFFSSLPHPSLPGDALKSLFAGATLVTTSLVSFALGSSHAVCCFNLPRALDVR